MRKYPSYSRLGREHSIEGLGERAWEDRGSGGQGSRVGMDRSESGTG